MGSRDIIHFYWLAVEADFYSEVFECVISDPGPGSILSDKHFWSVTVLTFMGVMNYVLSLVDNEQNVITSGPGLFY